MNVISITIPNRSEYLSSVRLLCSKVMAIKNMNMDDVEDMRVAAGELMLIAHDIEDESIDCIITEDEEKITLSVNLKNKYSLSEERLMSKLIIESLADEFVAADGKISLIKKIG